MNECNALGCFLERQGGLISFPLVTLAGLIDGINPCAIGMMVTLLGYLAVFGATDLNKDGRLAGQMLKIGGAYIVSIFVTYLVIGLMFYNLAFVLQQSIWARVFVWVIGGGLILAAAVQIKDVFWPHLPVHLRIPTASKKRLNKLIEQASLPAAVVLGVLVTILETPCSLPLYVGTASVLAASGLAMVWVVAYFLYYNFLFVLPLLIILGVMVKGKQVIAMREWEHRAKRWMHLGLGVVLLGLGLWLVLTA